MLVSSFSATNHIHRKEIQILLSESTELNLLVRHFNLEDQQRRFRNYFFDTPDLAIYHAGAVLRARHEVGDSMFLLSLILDDKKREKDHLTLPPFPIAELENLKRNFILPNGNFLSSVSQIIQLKDTFFKGSMEVERYHTETEYGFIKIDKSTFSEKNTDLEFKISIKPEMEELAERVFKTELCLQYGLTPDPFTVSKYRRFLLKNKLISL